MNHTIGLALLMLLLVGCSADPGSAASTAVTSVGRPPDSAGPTTSVAPADAASEITGAPTTVFAEPARPSIEVSEGSVRGPGRIEVDLGETVQFDFVSDVADELHIHGYDLRYEIVVNEPLVVELVADIPGIFEVEMEEAGLLVTELVVQ